MDASVVRRRWLRGLIDHLALITPDAAPTDVSDAAPTDVSDAAPTDVSDAAPTDVSDVVPTDVSDIVPTDVVDAVARRVCGEDVPLLAEVEPPPGGWADPWLIGAVHELTASTGERALRGAWYTPRPVVEELVQRALTAGTDAVLGDSLVIDPTCGGGGFLLAALDRLVVLGSSPDQALARIGGLDIDPGAVRATHAAVAAWGRLAGASDQAISGAVERICLGDQLVGWPDDWPSVSVVIGNPPFATPLRGGSFPGAAHAAREERRDRLGPYADLAAIHLAVCIERVAPGGRVCLVLPQSVLGGRDTAGLRSWVDDVAPIIDLWATTSAVFDASVRVWAPVCEKGAERPMRSSWSEAAAFALGVPPVTVAAPGRLGELLSSATAGFRDEFYALAEACVELADVSSTGLLPDGFVRVATVGSLDPLTSWWGRRPTTFAKRRWDAPVVDCSKVPGRTQSWLEQLRQPKVLLPTQSKVFEPFVDRDGTVAPVTPLLALHAEPDALDLVTAVLLAPPVVAWAFARWFGTAMSVEAIKIAARDLADFPLPVDDGAWHEAAAIVRSADGCDPADSVRTAIEAATLMQRAYGTAAADPSVLQWWLARARSLVPSNA
ncbi:MAG: N-6 DNA methylase [Acidimicrobiales bacterium]